MTAAPFTPVGNRARWRVIYDALANLEPGDVLTYGRAAELLDLHEDRDRHAIQEAVRRAGTENERVNKRVIEPVRNIGYRVIRAAEHAGIAKRFQRKSVVAIRAGASKVVNVRLDELDQPQRNAVAAMAALFARQEAAIAAIDVRQKNVEDVVAVTTRKVDRNEAEVAELRARLEALEQRNAPKEATE